MCLFDDERDEIRLQTLANGADEARSEHVAMAARQIFTQFRIGRQWREFTVTLDPGMNLADAVLRGMRSAIVIP